MTRFRAFIDKDKAKEAGITLDNFAWIGPLGFRSECEKAGLPKDAYALFNRNQPDERIGKYADKSKYAEFTISGN